MVFGKSPIPQDDPKAADAIRQLPVIEAPDSIWTALEASLDAGIKPTRTIRWGWQFATAAILVAAAGGAWWYQSNIPRTQWNVMRVEGSPLVDKKPFAGAGKIAVGEWLQTDSTSRAQVSVGEIGIVEVEPNTKLRLVAARPGENRLKLQHGRITATVSAPPRLFFVDTPTSTAVDLGCKYTMNVDDTGAGVLEVILGWVSLEWQGRDSLVPAGAKCSTRPRVGPGTPWFTDASEPLQQALSRFDFENGGSAAIDVVLHEARVRDTLTLWQLLSRVAVADRARVFTRMIELAPLPKSVEASKALQLDPETLTRWREELAWTW